jgi:hypothetical protein
MALMLATDTDKAFEKVLAKNNMDNVLPMVSIIEASISSTDEVIILVSKEGKKFPVNMQVAKGSSPYFGALLGSEMLESGKWFPSLPTHGKERDCTSTKPKYVN